MQSEVQAVNELTQSLNSYGVATLAMFLVIIVAIVLLFIARAYASRGKGDAAQVEAQSRATVSQNDTIQALISTIASQNTTIINVLASYDKSQHRVSDTIEAEKKELASKIEIEAVTIRDNSNKVGSAVTEVINSSTELIRKELTELRIEVKASRQFESAWGEKLDLIISQLSRLQEKLLPLVSMNGTPVAPSDVGGSLTVITAVTGTAVPITET